MRRFVTYDDSGTIVSTMDYDSVPEDIKDPMWLDEGEHALEVLEDKFIEMSLLEFHEGYHVNVKTKKLVKNRSANAE